MWSNALADSSRDSVAPVATLPMSDLKSSMLSSVRLRAAAGRHVPCGGQVEEILQDRVAVFRSDALGMKLHAVHGKRLVRCAHHQPVAGFGGDGKLVRQGGAIDHERVIARRPKRPVDAAEYALALMRDFGELAMHRRRRAHDLAAERLTDRLQAEADAE